MRALTVAPSQGSGPAPSSRGRAARGRLPVGYLTGLGGRRPRLAPLAPRAVPLVTVHLDSPLVKLDWFSSLPLMLSRGEVLIASHPTTIPCPSRPESRNPAPGSCRSGSNSPSPHTGGSAH